MRLATDPPRLRVHPDHGVTDEPHTTYTGPFARPIPAAGGTSPAPLLGGWVSQKTASRRLGVTPERIGELVAAGLLVGEWGPQTGTTFKNPLLNTAGWWIDHVSLVDLIHANELHDHDPGDGPEWGTEGDKLTAPEPAVLYGLLTLSDVRELRRRQALAAARTNPNPTVQDE